MIAKRSETRLADWMAQLRDWLNHHRIEPTGFNYADDGSGNQSCEVSFRDSHQADRFAAEFQPRPWRAG